MTLTRPNRLRILHAGLFALAILVCTITSSADTITLRGSVRLDAGDGPVTLQEVAELSGDIARQYGDVVVAERTGEVQRLTLADVRARLNEARVPWGRLNLSGRSVVIRPGRGAAPGSTSARANESDVRPAVTAPATPKAAVIDAPPTADVWATEPTRRGAVVRALAEALKMQPRDFRIRFDAHATHDLTARVSEADMQVRVDLSSAPRITVHIADAAGQAERHVRVETPKEIVTAARRVPRHAKIRGEDLERRTIWTTDLGAPSLPLDAVRDQVAARVINEGDVIEPAMLEAQRVIRRGDPVTVTRRVGMLNVTLTAKAMDDAALGDLLEVQAHGRRIRVVCTGDGAAVVDVNSIEGGA